MSEKNRNNKINAQERLLEAALDVFGRHGFEAATTRMIAREAKVNIASIPYYFGGKEGLYQAVIQHIVQVVQTRSGGHLQSIALQVYEGQKAQLQAHEDLLTLLERFVDFIIGSTEGPKIARILLREQMYPTSAYSMIFDGFMNPLVNAIAKLAMILAGIESLKQAKLKAMTIIGQVIVFRVGREIIVRSLDLQGYNEDEINEIKEVIFSNTRDILGLEKNHIHRSES